MIRIQRNVLKQIAEHGETTYPFECCGLLIGRFENGIKRVTEVLQIENAREDNAKHNRSLITPYELMRGERYAIRNNLEVVGNYHSHPDHPAVPSRFDLENALPVWSYVIVAIEKGTRIDLRSWEMKEDRSKFDEEEIISNKAVSGRQYI